MAFTPDPQVLSSLAFPRSSSLEKYRQGLRLASSLRGDRRIAKASNLNICLLEDNEADADLVQEYLEESGMCAHCFVRLSALVNYVQDHKVDVILSDLSLPDASGLEAVVKIRQSAPEAALIVLSGLQDEELALRAVQLGAQDYLVKGIANMPFLHRTIKYAMERESSERELASLAYYDKLTGLINRRALQDKLKASKSRADRSGSGFALLFIDLDKFKAINDKLGHDSGDVLLKEVSKRLSSSVRAHDVVSRYGGDEFIILLEDLGDDAIGVIKSRLDSSFSKPFILRGKPYKVGFSFGVARYPQDGADVSQLIRKADKRMYRHKGTKS